MVSVSEFSVMEMFSELISERRFWATFPYAEKCLDIRLGGVVDRREREAETSTVGVRTFFFPLRERKAHKRVISQNFIYVADPFILTKAKAFLPRCFVPH